MEKTNIVSLNTATYNALDVCTRDLVNNKNCSKYSECLQTMFILELYNRLYLYENIFYINKYNKLRNKYLGRILSKTGALETELLEYTLKHKTPVPFTAYAWALYYKLRVTLKKLRYMTHE